ncbi:MAG TPA: hypothetical protein VMQ62_13160 [Dongiaceae bacterium]|nr:hypothetical protein [Dongiaceae bacterium]
MDAIALAQSLDDARNLEGRISLHELRRQLELRGLHELVRAVDSLTGRLRSGRSNINETAPWV